MRSSRSPSRRGLTMSPFGLRCGRLQHGMWLSLFLVSVSQPAATPVPTRPRPVRFAAIFGDVSKNSGSHPELNMAGDAWEQFDANQGVPSPTKQGIVVVYTPTAPADINAFEIQTNASTQITLRPGNPPTVEQTCTKVTAPPDLSHATEGKCFYQITYDRVHIYYMGQLKVGEAIHYTIDGLLPATGAGVFQKFDSDAPKPPGTGPQPLVPPKPIAGRIPARLMLVLDVSPSMAWSTHPSTTGCGDWVDANTTPGCAPSRWNVLGRSVDAALTIASAYTLPGDQVALSPFGGVVSATKSTPLTDLNPGTIAAIRTFVTAPLEAINATSIGAGLEQFSNDFKPKPATERNQVVLLFTDGDQNTAPFVVS